MSWPAALSSLVAIYLLANVAFAGLYLLVGGVANLPEGSWISALSFSVQTMGTIGYGAMYPQSTGAHLLMVAESVVSLLLTALSTGLAFAKFSQPQGRIVFSDAACITTHDGKPSFIVRIGNERGNRVLESRVRMDATITTLTAEGTIFYRIVELPLVRSRIPALTRSFIIMHTIDERSPLHGMTPERAAVEEIEILVTLTGLDDTTGQTTHGQRLYEPPALRFGHRFADVLSATEDGAMLLDMTRFHDTVPEETSRR